MTELVKKYYLKKGDRKRSSGFDRKSLVRKRLKESRKMEGAMCDRREIALHGRSTSIKEVVIFMDYLDVGIMPGSNPHKAKKLGQMKWEWRKGT